MLDFVVAELDTLRSGHFSGNVSAAAESVLVGFVDDGRHEFGLHRTIYFDLHVAEAFVVVDGGAGLGFGGHQNFGWTLVRSGSIDDSGNDDAGADFFSVGNALAAGQERVGVVGQVADGGDSGSEVGEAVVIGDVGVHVPEAGEEGFARGGDDERRRLLGRDLQGWSYIAAALAGKEHLLVGDDFPGVGVEDIGVVEEYSAAGVMG